MVKKLIRHGEEFLLIIDKPLLEHLKIKDDTPLRLSTDGRNLYVTPIFRLENHTKKQRDGKRGRRRKREK